MCLLALVGVLCLPLSARVSLCLPPFIHLFPSIGGRVRLSGFLSSSVSFHLPCRFGDCFHVFEALFPFVSFCLQLSWLGRWRMGFWSFCFPTFVLHGLDFGVNPHLTPPGTGSQNLPYVLIHLSPLLSSWHWVCWDGRIVYFLSLVSRCLCVIP